MSAVYNRNDTKRLNAAMALKKRVEAGEKLNDDQMAKIARIPMLLEKMLGKKVSTNTPKKWSKTKQKKMAAKRKRKERAKQRAKEHEEKKQNSNKPEKISVEEREALKQKIRDKHMEHEFISKMTPEMVKFFKNHEYTEEAVAQHNAFKEMCHDEIKNINNRDYKNRWTKKQAMFYLEHINEHHDILVMNKEIMYRNEEIKAKIIAAREEARKELEIRLQPMLMEEGITFDDFLLRAKHQYLKQDCLGGCCDGGKEKVVVEEIE